MEYFNFDLESFLNAPNETDNNNTEYSQDQPQANIIQSNSYMDIVL